MSKTNKTGTLYFNRDRFIIITNVLLLMRKMYFTVL